MKNRKGFTIVELVIVIAVIAILAAVLIPTFSGVIDRANRSAATQEARTSLANILSGNTQGSLNEAFFFVTNGSKNYRVDYANQKLSEDIVDKDAEVSNKSTDLAAVDEGATYADYSFVVKDYTELTENEIKLIKLALGITEGTISPEAVEGQEFYKFTNGTVTYRVFYNGDLSGSCVVFIK
ncbi:MAG: type II secretion system GspH family protein [Clostridia bacterium]|nr:type II secretion system GspH family protein [Clostridia bacterium]